VQTWYSGLRAPNLMFPVDQKAPRRELTPVRLCSVRLSWRQRARPSTTLHEIQICRSRLEYIVCTTGRAGSQLWRIFGAEVVSTRCGWVGVLGSGQCRYLVEGRSPMKREFEFAWSFAMTLLLLAGSFAVAQNATTAKARKANGATSAAVTAANASQGASTPQTTQPAAVTGSAAAQSAATQPQPSTTATKPKTMGSADKRTIRVPEL
jgi:hypothetical protein